MHPKLIETTEVLNIEPSENSSRGDFDFLVGSWKIHNRKLKSRLNDCADWTEFEATGECRKILGGWGNVDSFLTDFGGAGFEGMALRLFNPQSRLWKIYWADNRNVTLDVPQTGSFDGDTGRFYARDSFEGKSIIVLFEWDKTNPDAPVWSQAFSADEAKTWEWNWYMSFSRQG